MSGDTDHFIEQRPRQPDADSRARAALDAASLDANERRLVSRMEDELRANRHKQSWTTLTPDYLLSELYIHVEKLIASGSWEHAADVANLAAMYVDSREASHAR